MARASSWPGQPVSTVRRGATRSQSLQPLPDARRRRATREDAEHRDGIDDTFGAQWLGTRAVRQALQAALDDLTGPVVLPEPREIPCFHCLLIVICP
jgi:hypothetical protein